MRKRDVFRRSAAARLAIALLPPLLLPAGRPALAFDHSRPCSEPYRLAGSRIVFATWYYVRPGEPDWLDPSGKSVFATRDKFGPDQCRFVTRDVPRGVRLVAEPARRVGPVITPEKPWEAGGIDFGTVLHEQGRVW